MKPMILRLLVVGLLAGAGLLGISRVAIAIPVATTALFDPTSPRNDFTTTDCCAVAYVYFQTQRNMLLETIRFFGEPNNAAVDASYLSVQLFETTSDWQTPGGNDDRRFVAQVLMEDDGRDYYDVTTGKVKLRKDSYYFLTLAISNMDWIQPFATNEAQTGPFLTTDERFLIFGYSNPALGPQLLRTPTWFLETRPVPEPGTLALLGLGLAGLGLSRRRKAN